MPPHVFENIAEMVIIATTMLSLAGIAAWTILRWRQPRRGGVQASELAGLQERLARLEQAVDAVAVEVERSGEAQRFTARLLAERFADGAAPRRGDRLGDRVPERAIAPHSRTPTPH